MQRSATILLVALPALGACGKERASSSDAGAPTAWHDFHEIRYWAPPGTDAKTEDGVLPGPGGQGGIPAGVRPKVTLVLPGPHGFYVEIIRTAEPVTWEGMKFVLAQNKVGTSFVGTTTSTGWELTYEEPGGGRAHVVYVESGGGHFQCVYSEANAKDPSAAGNICRSMKPRT